MNINRVQAAGTAVAVAAGGELRRAGSNESVTRSRVDRVEISGAAKELAKQYSRSGLTAERIQEVRQQIERGMYNEPEVVEELAWRLIEAGVV